jgi:succinate-acetate transporter protein
MPTLVIILIIAISFYLFYKVKEYRTKAPYEKRWIKTKANIALGVFLAVFGVNQLVTFRSTVELLISIVFLLLGLVNIWFGYKAYQHYLPHVIEEANGQKNR